MARLSNVHDSKNYKYNSLLFAHHLDNLQMVPNVSSKGWLAVHSQQVGNYNVIWYGIIGGDGQREKRRDTDHRNESTVTNKNMLVCSYNFSRPNGGRRKDEKEGKITGGRGTMGFVMKSIYCYLFIHSSSCGREPALLREWNLQAES